MVDWHNTKRHLLYAPLQTSLRDTAEEQVSVAASIRQ